jgi:hypothetical protein
LIDSLVFGIGRGFDTSVLESQIHEHFADFIFDRNLENLPLHVLLRVVNFDCGIDLMDFLMECLDRFGSSASILFDGLDFSRLSLEQIHRLERDDRIIWSFVGEMRGRSICSIVSKSFQQTQHISSLVKENELLQHEIERLGRLMVSARESFEREVADEHQHFETRLTSAVSDFESALKVQRKLLCSEMQELKDDCAKFSVEESAKVLHSGDLLANYEIRLTQKPARRIPVMLRS